MRFFSLQTTMIVASICLSLTIATSASRAEITEKAQVDNLNCKNIDNLPQQSMNQCAEFLYFEADKKLNHVYQRLLGKLEGTRRQKFISAAKAWINYRDRNCEFEENEFEGGTLATFIYYGCLSRVTKQRTSYLIEYSQLLE
jgi:uncharacterized protein YecT (DUF1311 family)